MRNALLIIFANISFILFAQDPCSASANLQIGMQNAQTYKTVIATEHSNSERTHVFPYTCNLNEFISLSTPNSLTAYYRSSDTLGQMYNTITRNRNELYCYGGCFGGSPTPGDNSGSWIVKLNANTLQTIWKQKLINTDTLQANYGEWNYPGVIGLNGDGNIYAIYGYRFSKIDTGGNVLSTITLPVGAGQLPKNTTYNGFTIMNDGFFIAKTMGRVNGCTQDGSSAFQDATLNPKGPCAGYDTIPSYLSVINPNTMSVTQHFSLGNFNGGRITSTIYNGVNYIYLTGSTSITRYIYNAGTLTLDNTWGPVNYRLPYNESASAIAVINGFIVLQTNSLPSPIMSVVAVSQANSNTVFRINPFQGQSSLQWLPSMLSVDPQNNRIYAMDIGSSKIAAINLTSTGLTKIYEIQTSSFSFVTLTGDSANRILSTTNLPTIQGVTQVLQAVNGTINLYTSSEELAFYNANTGSLIYKTPQYSPPMNPGVLITPGFNGVYYQMGLEGKLKEIRFTSSPLSIEENINELSNIKIYPNPAQHSISVSSQYKSKFELYNTLGHLIMKGLLQAGVNNLDLSNIKPGVYFFKLTNEGISSTQKLIIE
jgi:hypothetical protein